MVYVDDVMPFQDSVAVPKQLFVIAVTLATVLPRMPLDAPWVIGGHLSQSFRKLLLVASVAYLLRHWGGGLLPKLILLLMATLEGVSLSFLSLLTPYLLRKWMAQRVNIPGGTRNPGLALIPWLKLVVGFSLVGFLFRVATGDRRTWIIKRVADVLSFLPVMDTLRLYNTVTTSGAVYPGRGSVLSQVVVFGEYYAALGHSADIAIRFLGLLKLMPVDFTETTFAKSLHANVLFAGYFRVLCHSILLNILDETYILGSSAPGGDQENDVEAGNVGTSRSCTREYGPTAETVRKNENVLVPSLGKKI